MRLLKNYLSLFSGFALQLLAIWLEWLDNVELLRLQKIFYLSSILLIWIGIIQVLFRARAKNRRRKRLIDNLTETQQAKKIVELAKNPSKKGEVVVETFHLIQKGGKIVKAKFASLGIVQIVSLIATLLLLGLGVASAFYPELSVVADNIYLLIVVAGVSATPGIFAHGKDLGDQFKDALLRMNKIKELNSKIKAAKKELDKLDAEYAFLKPFLVRLNNFKIPLTGEQQIKYDTYSAQRIVLTDLIKSYEAEIVKLQEVPK